MKYLSGTRGTNTLTTKRFTYANREVERLTHYLIRYPAKFHPPIVRALIEEYSSRNDRILDPFCGSGSMLVEARVAGRDSIGCDIDPVAVFATRVKTYQYETGGLRVTCNGLREKLKSYERDDREYQYRQFTDIANWRMDEVLSKHRLWVPEIPNILHWFRRYVLVDLARIHNEISRLKAPKSHRDFLLLCFGSIIRAASNADPVPVSGLEVTAHMKRKDEEGRVINPFGLFYRAMEKSLIGVTNFRERIRPESKVSVFQANAVSLSRRLRSDVQVIITSPPYQNAVDYYRRHKLEMFWLGFTTSQSERLEILPQYIGRPSARSSPTGLVLDSSRASLALKWEKKIRLISPKRANAFLQYISSMLKVIDEFGRILKPKNLAIFVVGHSSWKDHELPTADLFTDMARQHFELIERFWYPVVNRYMSYSRHNGANINKEYILVFRRR